MENTFEANSKTYRTDQQTIDLMREYREAGNQYMVSVVFSLAKDFGRVEEVA